MQFHKKSLSKRRKKRGFTLIEVLAVVAILFVIIGSIAVPAFLESRDSAEDEGREARITVLNQAAQRARIMSLAGAGTFGSDKDAALNWYIDNGFLVNGGIISLEGIEFQSGVWQEE